MEYTAEWKEVLWPLGNALGCGEGLDYGKFINKTQGTESAV